MKLLDICLIYDCYNQYCGEYMIAADDALDILAEKIEVSDFLCNADLWIDGFNGFTPQEYKLLETLLKVCKTVNITLAAEPDMIKAEAGDGQELFYELSRTYKRLNEICKRSGSDLSADTVLPKNHIKNSLDLFKQFLAGATVPNTQTDSVIIFEASDAYEEIEFCAQEIINRVRDDGLRFYDCAVVCCDSDTYLPKLRLVFKRFGIPLFCDEKFNISTHRAVEFIKKSLETIVSSNSYESIFGMLKTGLSRIEQKEMDIIENYVLAHGIKGSKWRANWDYELDDDEDADVSEINIIRRKVIELKKPLDGFNRYAKYSVRAITEKLYEFLALNEVPEKLMDRSDYLMTHGVNERALIEKQVWPAIIETLNRLEEIIGGELVSVNEYLKIISAGFSTVKLGLVPPSLDCVTAGDLERSILPESKIVFILGLNDEVFPKISENTGLLSESDREILEESFKLELKTGGLQKTFNDLYQYYTVVCKASEKLYLCYSKANSAGREMKRSFVVDNAAEFSRSRILTVSNLAENSNIVEKNTAFRLMAKAFPGKEDANGQINCLMRYFEKNEAFSDRLKDGVYLAGKKAEKVTLLPETIAGFYGNKIKTSVTRLEKYNVCPFSYYVQYMLKAGERKLYDVRSIDIGNYFHEILDRFTKKLIIAGERGGWRKHSDTELMAMAEESVEAVFEEKSARKSSISGSEQNLYFKNRLKEMAAVSIDAILAQLRAGSFDPAYSEAEFLKDTDIPGGEKGRAVFNALELKLSNGADLILEGKVDRIDLMRIDEIDYVKIIDYKSGKKDFDLLELYYGVSMQLIIYMSAFLESVNSPSKELVRPAAALYFLIKNPIISSEAVRDGNIRERMLSEFKMKGGLLLGDTRVVEGIDNGLSKDNRRSTIIPVGYLKPKKDGAPLLFDSNSKQVDLPGFKSVLDYSVKKAVDTAERLIGGEITAKPFRNGKSKGCDYCLYRSICRFDPSIAGNLYNNSVKLKEAEMVRKILDESK